MATLVTDPELEESLLMSRRAMGGDRYDEVWEGIYVMSPLANNEHQALVSDLTTVLNIVVGWTGEGTVFAGVNVSDRREDWQQNYRCPDVAVFLRNTQAENHGAFWFGGPDFAVEITSRGEQVSDKFSFYARVGVRELLVLERDPWVLSLYRLSHGRFEAAGDSTADNSQTLKSSILPLSFRIQARDGRPGLDICRLDGSQSWRIVAR